MTTRELRRVKRKRMQSVGIAIGGAAIIIATLVGLKLVTDLHDGAAQMRRCKADGHTCHLEWDGWNGGFNAYYKPELGVGA